MKHTCLLLVCIITLSGCVSAVVEGGHAVRSEVIVRENIEAANAGNAEAQYKVGKAYCCSVHEGSGIYNTQTSVEWLCKSARQGYAPAMTKLGKIYSGDVIDGFRLARRIAQGAAGNSTHMPTAVTWLQMAKAQGDADAGALAQELWTDMDAAQRSQTQQTLQYGLNAPCEWNQVFAPNL